MTTKFQDIKLTVEEMNDVLKHSKRFVVLDIETTSLSPKTGGRIIEVAAVRIVDGKFDGEFSELINPQQKISKKTTTITKITNEMVKDSREYHDVLRDLYRFIGNDVVVAHNARFDWNTFLLFYFLTIGIIPDNRVIDTLPLARLYLPDLVNHKLNTICETLNIELTEHHRAIYDTRATANIVIHFQQHLCKQDFGTFESHIVQGDLFNMAILDEDEDKVAATIEQPKKVVQLNIKRIKYWEKEKSKKEVMRRIYVSLENGSCYFDVNKKAWFNKDIQSSISFDDIQAQVLKTLKLRTVEDLTNFRN